MIDLSDSEVNYTFDVDSDVDEVTIRATPEDDDYSITIDGEDVDEDNHYKTEVDLDKGGNKFEIELDDDNDQRVYTLVINRGNTSSTTSTTTNIKTSQWVQVNGKWQYNDINGNVAKNSWIQNYFVQANGNMATGWLNYNGIWYYLGTDGAKKTGWQLVSGSWYYLDTAEGRMQTGWIKDITGKYYYLNSNGSMAYNTTIGGYKLGTDGAWVK